MIITIPLYTFNSISDFNGAFRIDNSKVTSICNIFISEKVENIKNVKNWLSLKKLKKSKLIEFLKQVFLSQKLKSIIYLIKKFVNISINYLQF